MVKTSCEGACTTVRTCGVSEEFDIKVGLHQGSLLSHMQEKVSDEGAVECLVSNY